MNTIKLTRILLASLALFIAAAIVNCEDNKESEGVLDKIKDVFSGGDERKEAEKGEENNKKDEDKGDDTLQEELAPTVKKFGEEASKVVVNHALKDSGLPGFVRKPIAKAAANKMSDIIDDKVDDIMVNDESEEKKERKKRAAQPENVSYLGLLMRPRLSQQLIKNSKVFLSSSLNKQSASPLPQKAPVNVRAKRSTHGNSSVPCPSLRKEAKKKALRLLDNPKVTRNRHLAPIANRARGIIQNIGRPIPYNGYGNPHSINPNVPNPYAANPHGSNMYPTSPHGSAHGGSNHQYGNQYPNPQSPSHGLGHGYETANVHQSVPQVVQSNGYGGQGAAFEAQGAHKPYQTAYTGYQTKVLPTYTK